MVKQLTIITIIFLHGLSFFDSNAQQLDSLVFFKDITYASLFEKKVFKEFFAEQNVDYLALFMAIDKDITEADYNFYKKAFEDKLASINIAKLNKKREKKKIKYIYGNIHDAFLKKYELQNQFGSIFSKGYYNCVSGSALYGVVFDRLQIPYVVKEKPTHVYLMTYPESERILVEPTDPRLGYLAFNNIYKNAFIENLKSAKIISVEEATGTSVDDLFDKYYFTDENISIKELVGIQYSNDALYKLEKNDLVGALHQLEKAYLFYPSEKVTSLLFTINAEILSTAQYDDISYASFLAKLSRYGKFGITSHDIIGEFARANNILLIDKNNKEEYEKFYDALISQLNDTALINEISFLYNYENGRVLYNQGKYEETIKFLAKAFSLKPQNHDINNLFVAAINNIIRYQSDNRMALQNLEKYKNAHPQLMENNNFKSMMVSAYLIQAFYSFDLKKPDEGEKFKDLFKQHYSSDLTIDVSLIGRAYSNAAVYYFRRGNKSRALDLINEGLEIVPQNHELLMRKKMIKY